MNNARRKDLKKVAQQLALASEKLRDAVAILENASTDIEVVAEDEQMAYDNLPENFQESERGETMMDNVDQMTEIAEKIDEVKTELAMFVDFS